jgi:hypothetical protein
MGNALGGVTMGYFDPFDDRVPSLPVGRLQELQARAKRLLRGRTARQFRKATDMTAWLSADYFDTEKELWVQRQLEQGGYVLGYLSHEDRTESGLKELLANARDPDITCEFDFPREENTSELEALEGSLKGFNLDDKELPDAEPFEYLAVLALEQIARALEAFTFDDWPAELKEDAPMILLAGLANDAVNITETVCRAEALKARTDLEREHSDRLMCQIVDSALRVTDAEDDHKKQTDHMVKTKLSLAAARAANIRHKDTNDKKAAVLIEWDRTNAEYESRADFVRIVSPLRGLKYRTLYGWIAEHEKSKA